MLRYETEPLPHDEAEGRGTALSPEVVIQELLLGVVSLATSLPTQIFYNWSQGPHKLLSIPNSEERRKPTVDDQRGN